MGILVTKLFRNRCLRYAGSALFEQGCVGRGSNRAEDPASTQSPVIMALAQLIENAQALVDAVLERDFSTAK
ncbi:MULTISPECIES: hypothetical protein [unclassified Pseudomonas]|uniref:hypothetical protein n=1 Tax=unclassified Pseudomonas TaxID=196821 RepID=UPI001F3A4D3C|nr:MULTISPECIES: hypothetical protein [unclassified Pseudomonas]